MPDEASEAMAWNDDGAGSTTVQDNGGGSYTVTGSNPDDGDCNIYVEGTNEVIGQTFTPGEFSVTNDGTGEFNGFKRVTFNINALADGNKLVNSFSALWKATVLSMQSSYGAAITLAAMSRNGGTYDIKSRFGNPYTPFMFSGRVTTIRSLGNILFGRNLRAINRYSLDQLTTSASQWYMETMPCSIISIRIMGMDIMRAGLFMASIPIPAPVFIMDILVPDLKILKPFKKSYL